MRGSLAQLQDWHRQLGVVQRSMETVSGEMGPTKAENLVQYALEEVCEDIKLARQPAIHADGEG